MYYIGIDLGGTNIAVGLVDEEGRVVAKKSTKTLAQRDEDSVIADMAKTALGLLEECNVPMEEVASIGIGTPGSVDPEKGTIRSACNLNFTNTPLVEKISGYFSKPIYLENDANCAALAEAKVGAAKGADHALMVTLGTGIGGGIVINGKLYSGFNYYGGEFGHMIVHADGEECRCGSKGCWEAYASASALIRDTKRAAESNPDSLIRNCANAEGKFSGRTAFRAAALGDAVAQEVVDHYVRYLALGIVNLIRIFQPQIIVVGGGISHEGEALFGPLQKLVEQVSNEDCTEREKQTRVVPAALGNDAGLVGAAFLGKK